MSTWSSLCAQEYCNTGTYLGLLLSEKENRNATAVIYRDIPNNCVLRFGEETHIGVVFGCLHTFSHIGFLKASLINKRIYKLLLWFWIQPFFNHYICKFPLKLELTFEPMSVFLNSVIVQFILKWLKI